MPATLSQRRWHNGLAGVLFFGLASCVTTDDQRATTPPTKPATATQPAANGGLSVTSDAPGAPRVERRDCDRHAREERTGRAARPQIEAGVQSDGRPYVAGGCEP